MKRRMLMVVLVLLAGARLAAQVPSSQREPIRDPNRLAALGFPRDATNVYVASKRTESPETWGPATGYSTIMNYQLQPTNVTNSPFVYTLYNQGSAGTSCSGDPEAECLAYAQVLVPEGASLEALRIWAFDNSDDSDLHYVVIENCEPPGGPGVSTVIAEADLVQASGDYYHQGAINATTANNADCGYTVRVRFTDPGDPPRDTAIRLRKMAVTWFRQVSPAPAVATFGDVPTDHPFFQFIEALSRSGITGGCSAVPPLYCPDQPLTRGQMAVFLAKGLGLQWPLPLSE